MVLALLLATQACRAPLPRAAGGLDEPVAPASPSPAGPAHRRPWLLGQSAPLSGPSAQLGQEYRDGALAWFNAVNRQGGVHGRPIRLISLDDRYEPELTQRNTQALLQRHEVLALFGYVGTPTVKAVLPQLQRLGVPLVAPLTGASLLRRPTPANVINLRPSYGREIDRMIDALVQSGKHQIAVLHQADAFGADGLAAARAALARHRLTPVAVAAIARHATDAREAARTIEAVHPDGVIVITAYPTAAAVSLQMQQLRSRAQLMHVSFVGTRGLQDALSGGRGSGIGITQVVPFPWDHSIPLVADYQRQLKRQLGTLRFGYTSLEGFIAARLMVEALRRAGPDPTRAQLMQAFAQIGQLDLGGFQLKLGPDQRDASDWVDLTFLGAQRWEP